MLTLPPLPPPIVRWENLGLHGVVEHLWHTPKQMRARDAAVLRAVADEVEVLADRIYESTCLPSCDSHAHDALCPVVNPEAFFKAFAAELRVIADKGETPPPAQEQP